MKYALVTGCDHGVGLCLAQQLSTRGYATIACYLREPPKELNCIGECFPMDQKLIRLFKDGCGWE